MRKFEKRKLLTGLLSGKVVRVDLKGNFSLILDFEGNVWVQGREPA